MNDINRCVEQALIERETILAHGHPCALEAWHMPSGDWFVRLIARGRDDYHTVDRRYGIDPVSGKVVSQNISRV